MAKKKKPMWPIWVTIAILVGCTVLVLSDWKRYPSNSEMEHFMEVTNSEIQKVEVLKAESPNDAYEKSRVYTLKISYKDGRVIEDTHTVKEKYQKAVYPWHDYFEGLYPTTQNYTQ